MTTKLEAVREAIVKACPDIMELKFGCEFLCVGDEIKHFIYHVSQSHPFWFEAKTDGTNGHYFDFDKKQVKILGRPITLEDVLRAMYPDKSEMTRDDDWGVSVSSYDIAKLLKAWHLGLPLDQQPEPVIDFLHDLLANTETV